jgi:hypothetical protein
LRPNRFIDPWQLINPRESWITVIAIAANRAEVDRVAAAAAVTVPRVIRVYTREQLLSGQFQNDSIGRRVRNGFFAQRSPDIEVLLDPYWITSASGASHGAPFGCDTHAPIAFLGACWRSKRRQAPWDSTGRAQEV